MKSNASVLTFFVRGLPSETLFRSSATLSLQKPPDGGSYIQDGGRNIQMGADWRLKKACALQSFFGITTSPRRVTHMNLIRRWAVFISVITISAMLAGCAETQEGRTTQAQGAGLGALLGAALGAGIGAATGGGEGAAQGAIAGALIGGSAGFVYGTHVANQKAKYARAEDWMNACIASAHGYRRHAYAVNQKLSSHIASLEKRSKAARASHDKAAVAQIHTEIVSLKQQARSETKTLDTEVAAQQNALGDSSARKSAKYGELKQSVSELKSTKAQLGENYSRLAALENQTNI